MKNRILEKNRKQHVFTVATMVIVALFLLTGCGTKHGEFSGEIQSKSEPSLMEDGIGIQKNSEDTGDRNDLFMEPTTTDTQIENTTASSKDMQTQDEGKCYVHICGAVKQPGVYSVGVGARIYEVVNMAGGFREDACTEYLNQAASVTDGSQIRVPTLEEAKAYAVQGVDGAGMVTAMPNQDEKSDTADAFVNLNTATVEQLCTLPGIGNTKAASIISYREQTGGFRKTEEILNVDGIKTGTFEKIKDKIRV